MLMISIRNNMTKMAKPNCPWGFCCHVALCARAFTWAYCDYVAI